MIWVDVHPPIPASGSAKPPTTVGATRYSVTAKLWIALIIGMGLLAAAAELPRWHSADPLRFGAYFLAAALTSVWKVRLPQVRGTMSVNFFFILLGVVELTAAETMVLGGGSILIQYLWRGRTQNPVQAAFNLSSALLAAYMTHIVFTSALLAGWGFQFPLRIGAAAFVYFLINTGPVAIVISLTEGKPVLMTWRDCYAWSFAYYLVGAGVAGILSSLNARVGWQATVLVMPVIFIVYRSYSLYLERLEAEKDQAETQRKHAEAMASLHLRTIEALAMAIEAKDEVTHDHLQRVQVYSTEVGKELGMSEEQLQALLAASLLHDIGKLAVPEHIISKPGRLTPEEFEKMKIHPVVGAEILERVQFPYPVAPIVRHHHEKWDGSGYPDGLVAEAIPLGARILTAVDCLDALATDRQYRPALPLDDAMAYLVNEAGKTFDPQVVAILARRYRELEVLAKSSTIDLVHLNKDVKVERGAAPDAGFAEETQGGRTGESTEFVTSIAAARQEAGMLFEMSRDLVTGLNLEATMQAVGKQIQRLVPHDTLAVYLRNGTALACEFAHGEEANNFASLAIPLGQGLAGWVAENSKPIVNGNPSVETGYLNDLHRYSNLRSALALPLEGASGVIGVVALYAKGAGAFTKDHLRVLQVVTPRLTLALENIRRYESAESGAGTDYLTGLPNARGLFSHLEAVLAQTKAGSAASVIVSDLDGFKAVNDRFGHLEGNRILQCAAETFRASLRAGDYVSRMGGDEFVFVLPATGIDEALRLSIRLRDALENAAQKLLGERILSMSIGAACYPANGATPETILAEADRLMYIDKADRKSRRRLLQPGTGLAGLASVMSGAVMSGAAMNDRTPESMPSAPRIQ
jgi:diguanylate cyclase (GGDEF)-like protein/putative nucleotidyltransferase with HDIG domain